ncbi:MAG: (5-formylfuran-3-yl)methyl phosphate synthase [Methylococcales bacterium]
MTGMLASVQTLDEAQIVLKNGADIIDLKAPASGALGALPVDQVYPIVDAIRHTLPVSATIGDIPMEPQIVHNAVMTMAATRVDFVKIGFFSEGDKNATLDRLKNTSLSNTRLIAVLFADGHLELSDIAKASNAGFSGVMLDTQDKSHGRLTNLLTGEQLKQFVNEARRHQLLCGLAGSLNIQDISTLLPLAPDYLGFRGALCKNHIRIEDIDPDAVSRVKNAIHTEILPDHPISPMTSGRPITANSASSR